MKKRFSTSWKSSRQKRKQVKYRANAPLHLRKKMLSTSLTRELRKRYSRRSISLRKGDTVKILTGKFKGKTGKVDLINLKQLKVYIDGIQTTKQDGNKASIPIDVSNLQIQELVLEDKKRLAKRENPVKKEKPVEIKKDTKENKIKKINLIKK